MLLSPSSSRTNLTRRKKKNLLQQQGSQQAELLREQGAQFELLRQQQHNAAVSGPMHARRPEGLKIDIAKFKAVKGDSLMRWLPELDDAIEACRISDDAMKVMFGMSN